MQIASIVVGLLALGCLIGGGISLGRIVDELRSRDIPANYWSIRWMFPRYLAKYRQVTLEEDGEVGPLFATSGGFFALAAIFTMAALILTFLSRL